VRGSEWEEWVKNQLTEKENSSERKGAGEKNRRNEIGETKCARKEWEREKSGKENGWGKCAERKWRWKRGVKISKYFQTLADAKNVFWNTIWHYCFL